MPTQVRPECRSSAWTPAASSARRSQRHHRPGRARSGLGTGDHRCSRWGGPDRHDPLRPVRAGPAAGRGCARAVRGQRHREPIEYIQGDPADSTGFARATVLDLLVKYPEGELDAVWAGWDASAVGAYQATQETGRTEVLVTGVDGANSPSPTSRPVATGSRPCARTGQRSRPRWPTSSTRHFAGHDHAEGTVFVDAVVITAENAQ